MITAIIPYLIIQIFKPYYVIIMSKMPTVPI